MTGSFGNFRFPGRKEVGKNAQYLVVYSPGAVAVQELQLYQAHTHTHTEREGAPDGRKEENKDVTGEGDRYVRWETSYCERLSNLEVAFIY